MSTVCDLLVVGAGAAGMTAAFVGALEGLRPTLCESMQQVGGATATYAGRLWIPGNGQGLHADYEDSPRLVAHYLDALLDGADPRGLRQTFIASGPDVLDDLAARSHVQFTSAGRHPDSVVASGAAKTGRAAYHAASQAFARSVAPSYRGVNPQPTSTFQHV